MFRVASLTQAKSFKYSVRKAKDAVEVTIHQRSLKAFWLAFLWATFWVFVVMKSNELGWSRIFIVPLCLLLASIGIYSAVRSVWWHTLIISSSDLSLRVSSQGISRTRTLNVSDIEGFGFGLFSHSLTPVLKLEVRTLSGINEWIVLASNTTEQEVEAFLQDVEAEGFNLSRFRLGKPDSDIPA